MRLSVLPLVGATLLAGALTQGCSTFGFNRPVDVQLETRETRGGVEYTDPRPGSGPRVVHGSHVVVHYSAYLEDGTQFDSSYDRGVPEEFDVGSHTVIRGWEQGLLGMQAGGQRRMVLPPEMAYGAEGLPGLVPPDATIVLVVDLLETSNP